MDYGFEDVGNSNADSASTERQGSTSRITDNMESISDDVNLDSNGNPIEDTTKADEDKKKTSNKDDNADKSDKDNNDSADKDNDSSNKSDDDTKDGDTNLKPGYSIEVGDDTYTVDKDGNLVGKDGKIFKEAKAVAEWMKQFDVDDTNQNDKELSIESIKDVVGIEITDDNDKPIEFDNTPEGIAAYIDAVIETTRDEHMEAAINTLYQKYPIIEEVLNYYIANGNSLNGFGEIPDRTGITIDDTNEAQQENIIRIAWDEQGRKGDVNAYIQYLKSSGTLLAVSKEELAGLQESDRQYREELEQEAELKEQERIKQLEGYWNDVKKVVDSKKIAGYTIPDSIIINKDGQKYSATPQDFFNYIYRVDSEGKSAYERDLAKETPESRRDDELLRAYLKFVGGNYSNLVDMAVNDKEVTKLKLIAKERKQSSIKIKKPKANTNSGKNIDLGY